MVADTVQKSSFRPGPLVLLLILIAVIVVYVQRLDVESYLTVQTERSIPLLLQLDDAVQASGFPEGQRFMKPLVIKDPATGLHENLDDEGIAIPTALNGEVVFPGIPIHANARLRTGFGIELVQNGAGVPVTYSVAIRSEGEGEETERELLREVIKAPSTGAPPVRVWGEAAIPPPYHDSIAELVFRTSSPIDLPNGGLYPVILSPVVTSKGKEQPLDGLTRTHEIVVDDLLSRYEAAIEEDSEGLTAFVTNTLDTCFAIRVEADGSELPIAIETSAIDPALQTDSSAFAERGGAWPALVFGWEGPIVRYPLQVPDDGNPRLRFAIGIDERSFGVGTASFGIGVDGEPVFMELLDPSEGRDGSGWHEREVDLGAYAGKEITLEFNGVASAGETRTWDLEDRPPLAAVGTPYRLHVKRVRAGFARPRIVVDRTVPARHSKRGERRSVIVVNVETLRADALHCYGGIDGISPAIDRLAKDGTLIQQCVSSSSWTAPSVASVLTGKYPQAHGVRSYAQSFLADGVTTLAEAARADGVATAAFVTNELLGPRHNFDQGFDDYLFCPEANARQIVSTFSDWLENHRELQFFAYLHLFEPHDRCDAPGADRERYVPERLRGQDDRVVLGRVIEGMLTGRPPKPEDDDVQFLRGRYHGEIRYLDRQIDRLRTAVEEAGLSERVVIILTSDHGEEFGEHGLVGHGSQLFGETVLVPLIFFGDGVPKDRIIRGPVENRRIFGAVLDLLGAPRDREVHDGIDLDASNVGGRAYSMTEQGILRIDPPDLLTRSIHLLRNNRGALHYSPRGRIVSEEGGPDEEFPSEIGLYSLDEDQGERQNHGAAELGGELQQLLAKLKSEMKSAYRNATARASALPRAGADAVRESFGGLGYVSGSATDEDELFSEEDSSGSDERDE